jgi:RNA ligase (TIGR02306 family)
VFGEVLTTLLGIQKYIKEIPANLSGETLGDFPTNIISKTDEDNGLNDPELVDKVLSHDSHITITQKLDGSSITLIIENGELTQVCTRNLSKKETENNSFWKAARKLSIPKNWTGTIQGELCGNGIQQNRLKLEDIKIFVFQISQDRKYMTYGEMKNFCEKSLLCNVVPLVSELEVESTIKLWENPLQKLQELADKQKYSSGLEGEGIVVRPSSYPRGYASRRPLGFKLINRNYKD